MTKKSSSKLKRNYYQPLIAAALAASSAFHLVGPVLAFGTAAGQSISNTATATYEDPNNPNVPINATSNTVTVTVAEVAGITVTASGTSLGTDADSNGKVSVNDILNYTYTITNVGNDPTKFRIPNLAEVTGPGTVSGNLQISTDGGVSWTDISGSEIITNSIPSGGSVMVRVPVKVTPGAKDNDIINVTLGDTPGDAQNQLRNPNGGDVYTVDNTGTQNGDIAGDPVNGVREASVTQKATVSASLKNYALASILKTRGNYDNGGTSAITDDKLTYNLSLKVAATDPTGNNFNPAPLVGTEISVNSANVSRILVSDAIPKDTELAVAPTPPPGWQVVYTTDAVTTTALDANWTTTAPANLATVTRIGFINNSAIVTAVAPGETVNGFSVQVKVKSSVVATSLDVANIAQLLGQTSGVPTTDTNNDGTPDNLIYDESGDQNPSNFNGSTPPGTDTNSDGIPDTNPPVADGYVNDPADLGTIGTDSGNNNTGTGTGGEANLFTVQQPVASSVQTGPDGAPDAIGPTNNNDDFTNKSSLVPAGTKPGTTIDPAAVGFTNTVKNSGTDAGLLTLTPKAPATATDLPANTTVTITYASSSATYIYDGAGTFTLQPGNLPITIANFDPNEVLNYGVEVNLPSGTPLSTDLTRGDKGFPVPIEAAIDLYTTDTNADGIKDTGNDGTTDATNTTIDRVYTGFLKLLKESRVLPGTGPAVLSGQNLFSIDPKTPSPGNILEYRINYTNISTPQAGTGNVILKANDVVITEDGTQNGNNWALDNDTNGAIDTSNIVGTAKDSGASTITFFSGNPATKASVDQTGTTVDTDVTKYINTVIGDVAPGEARNFLFQRQVESTNATGTPNNPVAP
ncbi:beta strand repeat-containing protein [Limnofasciculus baicalensis]|uniref:DUF7925 domain-containing protein n=1 Tax=Limnofasciculus baicalensis BBK-W-15 TaxID=2699891 RepID=A0AAE3KMK5_9CYAN|nr:hypothetical protein [Limnofasciculus baicalensis]MCP2729329.1 hypothetical protein [Limnofasciculus baicalensis BBK-W-15]